MWDLGWFGLQQFRDSGRLWLLQSGFGHSQKVLLVLGKQTLEFPGWEQAVGISLPAGGCAGVGQLQTWAQGKGSSGFTGIVGFGNILLWAVLELLILGSAVCVPGNVVGFLHFLLNIQGVG